MKLIALVMLLLLVSCSGEPESKYRLEYNEIYSAMKTVAFICLLLLAGTAWAGDIEIAPGQTIVVDNPILIYPPPGPDGRIPMVTDKDDRPDTKIVITKPENRERLISEWASSGEICRVLGHRWNPPYLDVEHSMSSSVTYVYAQRVNKRECSICGKTETKEEVWR